jgi:hypothetical protein
MGVNAEKLYGGKPKPEQVPPKQVDPKKVGAAALKASGVNEPGK